MDGYQRTMKGALQDAAKDTSREGERAADQDELSDQD